jgi:hypothetical protein
MSISIAANGSAAEEAANGAAVVDAVKQDAEAKSPAAIIFENFIDALFDNLRRH